MSFSVFVGFSVFTDSYSDQDMQCPSTWENGFKPTQVAQFGEGDRSLSDPRTGDWTGSTFSLRVLDPDLAIRQRVASGTQFFGTEPLTVKMTTRANRAVLGIPYTVFVGPLIEAQPSPPLAWDLTLADLVSQTIITDQAQQPWRRIGDGFLNELSRLATDIDFDTPEPIIYGENRRVPGIDPASPLGFCVAPTYLGTQTVGGDEYHVWLVAGHACQDIPDLRVDGVSVFAAEGTDWLIPHSAGWTSAFTTPYRDFTDGFGDTRRYTLIYGLEGAANPDDCASGDKQLTVAVNGIEDIGDGSGTLITDRLLQYKHFVINYVAQPGQASYRSGAWLANPTWDAFGVTVPIVDEDSFDACSAIGIERLPADGYVGAAVIGATSSDRASVRKWIADWNRSCGVRFGITHYGQMRVTMLHPTTAIKAAAPLYDDVNAILKDSFRTSLGWRDQANRVPWVADYNLATGQWATTGVAIDNTAAGDYGRDITGPTREYPFAPGETAANHLARIELLVVRDPPRVITIEAPVTEGATYSLGYLDLGDYVRYRHFGSVGTSSTQIRLAQIQRHQVQAGARRVLVEAVDCEDLIDYDAPVA